MNSSDLMVVGMLCLFVGLFIYAAYEMGYKVGLGEGYLRAALSCVGALYLSGISDPKVLANAFIAGLIGPVLKALAPNEKQLGIGAK